jgi:uncharacterized membrane protein
MRALYILIILMFATVTLSHAHGGKKHKKDSLPQDSSNVKVDSAEHDHQHSNETDDKNEPVNADLDDFPSLHPLIVHFAIVLIVIATFLQIINVWLMKREFAWVITGCIVIGFNTALVASTKLHPHTAGLSEHAKLVLQQHDLYADWTLYLAGLAGTLQIINLFVFKQKRWAVAVVSIAMIAATYCVIHAGHYGAQLVHIEGVGPQGKFLEQHHEH